MLVPVSCSFTLHLQIILYIVTIVLFMQSGYWVSGNGPGSGLSFLPCPPGYCGCSQNTSLGASSCVTVYTNSNPDLQCVCERKGTLQKRKGLFLHCGCISFICGILAVATTFYMVIKSSSLCVGVHAFMISSHVL